MENLLKNSISIIATYFNRIIGNNCKHSHKIRHVCKKCENYICNPCGVSCQSCSFLYICKACSQTFCIIHFNIHHSIFNNQGILCNSKIIRYEQTSQWLNNIALASNILRHIKTNLIPISIENKLLYKLKHSSLSRIEHLVLKYWSVKPKFIESLKYMKHLKQLVILIKGS